ncbi:DNA-3-methyladenine glycosylase II [Devosia enhydra]|uniref:DNA-3-methyladenine glycosylase II n=1 Tax=Devosia enhydra TaxID=665118 RepID=A0A1K2I0J7_9HYPH|nr:DNA-3-methyladenine glycosylase [Devosia enhydra]SFZ85723.1 DNA-3-methyladenine glycosylase II [Devosia enhydra]
MTDPVTHRLTTAEAIAEHLHGLIRRDGRLADVVARAGPVDVRMTEPGFAGMAKVICGQQLSVASARAIWTRFAAIEGATDPGQFLLLPEETIRASGFSAGKTRTLRAVAEAVVAGELDFSHIELLPAEAAIARLTAIKGIGPWTAEIYLMFCAGHPDVFPSGDLALQKAVAHALGLDTRPAAAELAAIAKAWSPHRAAAALLFWRYFAAIREREGIAL